jgi:N-acyl-D-aspartate/D-glutamate deacylase
MIDLVIRGGRLVDGSGGEITTGDVGVDEGRLVHVGGPCPLAARRVFEADGALVTPGFVDVHTHYDAQLHWDPLVSPSSEHGVTTVVVGNCGLGLAPARPQDRPVLERLLGGVEDIPQASIEAGLEWGWEDFPDYLDALASSPRAVEVGALVGHAALRIHALGAERAFGEKANEDDLNAMCESLRRALSAGALGFSTSRSRLDRDSTGRPTPSCFADDREDRALARTLAGTGRGVYQLAFRGSAGDDPDAFEEEILRMGDLARSTGLPVTFGLAQLDAAPDLWRRAYEIAEDVRRDGAQLRPQTLGRSQSVLVGLETVHPFAYRPSYGPLAALPLAERVQRLRDPDTKRRILSETSGPAPDHDPFSGLFDYAPERLFPIDERPDYEPGPDASLATLARKRDREPFDLLYDLILEQDGRALLLYPVANYHAGDDSDVREMIDQPSSLLGLADGGAHSGLLCDASIQTYLLTHWTRDRSRGPRFPIERIVHKLTAETADVFGLTDRGRLRPGLRADLNVIDRDALAVEPPRIVHDLPAGGRRIVQGAQGYLATFVGGTATRESGVDTGARPGGLARPAGPS